MIVSADASFLVSLYGGDPCLDGCQCRAAFAYSALRFESENALRLACFRKVITPTELALALAEIVQDLLDGILISTDLLPANLHWEQCRSISAAHTLSGGYRVYDITHVAAALVLKADVFLSFDMKQRTLAAAVGLMVGP